jgi:hypothetical protein
MERKETRPMKKNNEERTESGDDEHGNRKQHMQTQEHPISWQD